METEIQTETTKVKTDRKTYMREYMKRRYQTNVEESRRYGNAVKYRRRHNISPEDAKEYGIHLAEVVKLKQIISNLPADILSKVLVV
jgi:hypothetical protein